MKFSINYLNDLATFYSKGRLQKKKSGYLVTLSKKEGGRSGWITFTIWKEMVTVVLGGRGLRTNFTFLCSWEKWKNSRVTGPTFLQKSFREEVMCHILCYIAFGRSKFSVEFLFSYLNISIILARNCHICGKEGGSQKYFKVSPFQTVTIRVRRQGIKANLDNVTKYPDFFFWRRPLEG